MPQYSRNQHNSYNRGYHGSYVPEDSYSSGHYSSSPTEVAPTAPVYGPSTSSPYQQFYDPRNGQPLQFLTYEEQRQQLEREQQFYPNMRATQQQQQQQQQQPAPLNFHETVDRHQHYGPSLRKMPSVPPQPLANFSSHTEASAEPCQCIYCDAAKGQLSTPTFSGKPRLSKAPVQTFSPIAEEKPDTIEKTTVEHVVEAPPMMKEEPRTAKKLFAAAVPTVSPSKQATPSKPAKETSVPRQQRNSAKKEVPVESDSTPSRRTIKKENVSTVKQTRRVPEERTPKGEQPQPNTSNYSKNTPNTNNTRGAPQSHPHKPAHMTGSHQYPMNQQATRPGALFFVELAGHNERPVHAVSHIELDTDSYVVFEGDRGDDMARVTKYSPLAEAPAGIRVTNLPMIIRDATDAEVTNWCDVLAVEAKKAVEVCSAQVRELGLKLTIVSASYQMDKNKLTFFYDTEEERVDFRKLLSDMYGKFRCRIWLERA